MERKYPPWDRRDYVTPRRCKCRGGEPPEGFDVFVVEQPAAAADQDVEEVREQERLFSRQILSLEDYALSL